MQSLKYLRHRLLITGYSNVHNSGHLHGTRTITKRTSLAYSARKVQMFFWMSFKNIMFIFFLFFNVVFFAISGCVSISINRCKMMLANFIFHIPIVIVLLFFSFEFFVVNDIVSWHQVYFLLSSIPSARSFAFVIKVKNSSLRYRKKNHSLYVRRPFCLA